jgi:hypothetical protein
MTAPLFKRRRIAASGCVAQADGPRLVEITIYNTKV